MHETRRNMLLGKADTLREEREKMGRIVRKASY